MELAELEIFRTVVAEGGVTRAAERLNRVQSNVTTRIKQLEQSIGVPLFVRDRKRLVLTASGEALLDYAERILDLVQEAREVVSPQNPRGRLRIGSMESAAASRLPAPLAEFHQRWPEVRLELSTGPTDVLIAGVRAGKLDAALVAGPIEDAALSATPLYKEELLLVTPRSHRRVRSPEDVMLDTLIVFEQGCAYRRHAESWFAGQGKAGAGTHAGTGLLSRHPGLRGGRCRGGGGAAFGDRDADGTARICHPFAGPRWPRDHLPDQPAGTQLGFTAGLAFFTCGKSLIYWIHTGLF
jgi:Transcriptional regulator